MGDKAAPPHGECLQLGVVVLKLVCIPELRKNTDVQDPCQRRSLNWFGVQPTFRYLPKHRHSLRLGVCHP